MAGLRVRDVDLAAGHVEVRQTAQFIRGGWVFSTPKSRRSSREVPILDRKLLADLKAFKMQHAPLGCCGRAVLAGADAGFAFHRL